MHAYLEWVARENGMRIVFERKSAEYEAKNIWFACDVDSDLADIDETLATTRVLRRVERETGVVTITIND